MLSSWKKNRLWRKFCPESSIKWITQNCLYGWTCLQTHLAKQRLFNFLSKIQHYTHDQVLAWSPGYFFFPVNQRNTFINLLKLSRHSSETWHTIWLSFPNSKCKLQKEEWVFASEPPDGNTAQQAYNLSPTLRGFYCPKNSLWMSIFLSYINTHLLCR